MLTLEENFALVGCLCCPIYKDVLGSNREDSLLMLESVLNDIEFTVRILLLEDIVSDEWLVLVKLKLFNRAPTLTVKENLDEVVLLKECLRATFVLF